MTATLAAFARRYAELGLALTWTTPGNKGPRHPGWNLRENAIATPADAFKFWTENPTFGIGALLSYSGLVSLDVDHVAHSREVLRALGVNLDELAAAAPCIVGRPDRFRLMFRSPAGVDLRHRNATWPKRDRPREGFVLFELRAGAVSDALPPTIHVDTREPYRWANPPREGFPELPERLLELWQDWQGTDLAIRARCSWYEPPQPKPVAPRRPRAAGAPSVIEEFNRMHDCAELLEAAGYKRRGRRFASPDTSHAAGIVLLESGRAYCHHAGDPLGGGRAFDAFALYAALEHGGDTRAAVRAAAEKLGLRSSTAA